MTNGITIGDTARHPLETVMEKLSSLDPLPSRETPLPFTLSNEEKKAIFQAGGLEDRKGRRWNIHSPKSRPEFPELYCESLHISIPFYDHQAKPVDPMAKFK